MTDFTGNLLVDVKQHLLDASAQLMAVFDAVEGGDVTPEATAALVGAHENLMEVHAAFKVAAMRRLLSL